MLPKSFKAVKCKTTLKLAIARLKLMRNKKAEQLKLLKREVAQLLEKGQEQTARLRVEQVIQEEKALTAYELIELYCEIIIARMPVIESQKKCPVDLKEAIAGVIYSSPRCADISELMEIRKHFSAKYGKEFVVSVLELRPDCGVSNLIVEKLSVRPSEINTKNKFFSEIAKEFNVKWEAPAPEETIRIQQSGVLPSPSYFSSASPSSHRQSQSQEPSPRAQTDLGRTSQEYRESSMGRQKWEMNFQDATSAAQAAAESADMASFAARAAAELASRGDFSGSPTLAKSQSGPFKDQKEFNFDQDRDGRDARKKSQSDNVEKLESDSDEKSSTRVESPKNKVPARSQSKPFKDQKEFNFDQDQDGRDHRKEGDPRKKSPRSSHNVERLPKFYSTETDSDEETSTKVESPKSKVPARSEQRIDITSQDQTSAECSSRDAGKKSPRSSDFPKFDSPERDSEDEGALFSDPETPTKDEIDRTGSTKEVTGKDFGLVDIDPDQKSWRNKERDSRMENTISSDFPKFDSPKSDSEDEGALFSDLKTSTRYEYDSTGFKKETTGKDLGFLDFDSDQKSRRNEERDSRKLTPRSSDFPKFDSPKNGSEKEVVFFSSPKTPTRETSSGNERISKKIDLDRGQRSKESDSEDEEETSKTSRESPPAVQDKDRLDEEQRLLRERFSSKQKSPKTVPQRQPKPTPSDEGTSSDKADEGLGLKFGRLTGGLRNKGQIGPDFSSLSRLSPREIKTQKNISPRTVETTDAAIKARSPRTPDPKIVSAPKPARNSDSDDQDQFPKTATRWTRGGGVSMRRPAPSPRNKPEISQISGPGPKESPLKKAPEEDIREKERESPIYKPEKMGPEESPKKKIGPEEGGIEEESSKPEKAGPGPEESPKNKKSPEESSTTHVHPKLPDYESLQARFRALRSNRR